MNQDAVSQWLPENLLAFSLDRDHSTYEFRWVGVVCVWLTVLSCIAGRLVSVSGLCIALLPLLERMRDGSNRSVHGDKLRGGGQLRSSAPRRRRRVRPKRVLSPFRAAFSGRHVITKHRLGLDP